MCNVCNIRLPQAMADVISSIGISIGIGTAAADSIRYRAPAGYRSNPTSKGQRSGHSRRGNNSRRKPVQFHLVSRAILKVYELLTAVSVVSESVVLCG